MNMSDPFDDDLTETQRDILKTAKRNNDATNKEIAEQVGCSQSYVSEVLNEHGDPREQSGGALKWLIIGAIILGGLALISEGEESGSEALIRVFWAISF